MWDIHGVTVKDIQRKTFPRKAKKISILISDSLTRKRHGLAAERTRARSKTKNTQGYY